MISQGKCPRCHKSVSVFEPISLFFPNRTYHSKCGYEEWKELMPKESPLMRLMKKVNTSETDLEIQEDYNRKGYKPTNLGDGESGLEHGGKK